MQIKVIKERVRSIEHSLPYVLCRKLLMELPHTRREDKAFVKDKFTASGAFDKYKARMVAGDNRQGKSLYDDLRSQR